MTIIKAAQEEERETCCYNSDSVGGLGTQEDVLRGLTLEYTDMRDKKDIRDQYLHEFSDHQQHSLLFFHPSTSNHNYLPVPAKSFHDFQICAK